MYNNEKVINIDLKKLVKVGVSMSVLMVVYRMGYNKAGKDIGLLLKELSKIGEK